MQRSGSSTTRCASSARSTASPAGPPVRGRVRRAVRPVGELAESGRGLDIMSSLVDDLALTATPDGVRVVLRKRLTWNEEAPLPRLESELVRSAG